jgi:hypothetical protein
MGPPEQFFPQLWVLAGEGQLPQPIGGGGGISDIIDITSATRGGKARPMRGAVLRLR